MGLKWSELFFGWKWNGSKWSQMEQFGPKWSELFFGLVGWCGSKWFNMVQSGLSCFLGWCAGVVPNGPTGSKVV